MSFSLNQPPTSPAKLSPGLQRAITTFHEGGAHYVLLNKDSKTPIWKAYHKPKNRPALHQVLNHLAQGKPVGVIPASINLLLLDVDQVSPQGLQSFLELHPPAYSHPSATPGHYHLWYHSAQEYRSKNRVHIAAHQLTCDVRSANEGYAVLYEPENLLQALRQHRDARAWLPDPNGLYYKLRPYLPPPPRRKRSRAAQQPQQQKMLAMTSSQQPKPLPSPPPEAFALATIQATQKGARNITLFDQVRWTYRKLHRNDATTPELTQQDWTDDIIDTAIRWNARFPEPLSPAETAKTAVSIANYLWHHPSHGRKSYLSDTDPATQRSRQQKQAQSRRARNRPRDRLIEALYNEGLPQRAIAQRVGLTPGRISQLVGEIRRGSLICQSPPQPAWYPLAPLKKETNRPDDDNGNNPAARRIIRNGQPELQRNPVDNGLNRAELATFDPSAAGISGPPGLKSVDNSGAIVDNCPNSVGNPVDNPTGQDGPPPPTGPVGRPASNPPHSPRSRTQAQNQNNPGTQQHQHTPEEERSAKQKCNDLQPKAHSPPWT